MLNMAETIEGSLSATFEYNTDLFEEATINRMAVHFRNLLERITASAQERLANLNLLTEAERRELLIEWNDTDAIYPEEQCLHHLFQAQAARAPDDVALIYEGQSLTYAQLNARANQLAHYLQSLGVGPEVLVGILMTRSIEMVVSLLAVLKAGGAYVPLDPEYPLERLAFMLEDSQARILLTQERLAVKLSGDKIETVFVDTNWERIASESAEDPRSEATGRNVAYLIYTSGSTGRPKAVVIEHRSPVSLLYWARKAFTSDALTGVLASTSICFDLSIFELFVPLSWGGTVILAQNALQLPHLPAAHQVTLINTVPSAMVELERLDGVPPSVRVVNLAGEALHGTLVRQIYARETIKEVYNLYGPSETTTYSTYTMLERGVVEPTIGRPVANTQIYILDAYLQPVPIGVPGEVYIGGAGLARGYLRRAEITAERFMPDQFGGQPGARMYKTGDQARYLPDGRLEYLGRLDHQVKVRGYRIELGEIEAALLRQPAIRQAVVVARQESETEQRLVAYVVAEQETEFKVSEARQALRKQLPEYMVPQVVVILEEMPLTANGKVDRRRLPAPEQARPELEKAYVAPGNEVEQQIAAIWQEVLHVERVGIHDNFFDLGGHSLLATQVVSRIRDALRTELPLRNIFETPTIAGLSLSIIINIDEPTDGHPGSIGKTTERTEELLLAQIDHLSEAQIDLLFSDMLNEKRLIDE
jgi:amino acid adenylation domain-containing protein